eukprot:Anaeramoba_flamelloidesa87486_160.p1 GENE.a87486_160~~a87486_160.p1  ORF type:complete len:105 (+),score=13.84 a87486_160:516-830(+)
MILILFSFHSIFVSKYSICFSGSLSGTVITCPSLNSHFVGFASGFFFKPSMRLPMVSILSKITFDSRLKSSVSFNFLNFLLFSSTHFLVFFKKSKNSLLFFFVM